MPRNNSKAQLWQLASIAFEVPVYLSLNSAETKRSPSVLQLLAEENEVRLVQICSPQSLRRISQNPTTACAIQSKLGVKIECQSDSLQAIDSVLVWATRQQDSGFQQLIVRD